MTGACELTVFKFVTNCVKHFGFSAAFPSPDVLLKISCAYRGFFNTVFVRFLTQNTQPFTASLSLVSAVLTTIHTTYEYN